MRIYHLVEAESLWALSQRGSVNLPQVRELQDRLRAAGHDPGPSDGWYGQRTADAVRAYQQANNLVVDGDAGPQTLSSLGMAGAQATPAQPTTPAETPPAPAPRQPAREPASAPAPRREPEPEPEREPAPTRREPEPAPTRREPETTPEPTRREPETTTTRTSVRLPVPPEEQSDFRARQADSGFFTRVDPRFEEDPFGTLDDEGDWTPVPNNTAKARVLAAKSIDSDHFVVLAHSIWGVKRFTGGIYRGQYSRSKPENSYSVKAFNMEGDEIAITNRQYNDTNYRSVEAYYNADNFEFGQNFGRRDELSQIYYRRGRAELWRNSRSNESIQRLASLAGL